MNAGAFCRLPKFAIVATFLIGKFPRAFTSLHFASLVLFPPTCSMNCARSLRKIDWIRVPGEKVLRNFLPRKSKGCSTQAWARNICFELKLRMLSSAPSGLLTESAMNFSRGALCRITLTWYSPDWRLGFGKGDALLEVVHD